MRIPKLTIVIPTRERADTLIHTLQTVVEQDYENLEIIVSDNGSLDNTQEVVRSFTDKRLRYLNTGKRMGMSENWEFALSHVTGDYVMYLGDDDGMLPNACRDVAHILSATNTKALIWNKPNYNWPSITHQPNTITIQCAYDLCEMYGNLILKGVASGKTSYGRLPVLYSGFVSTNSINNIKKKTGLFFHSITPDIYSGLVLAEELKKYLYSFRPFSISGGSSHSNGISFLSVDVKGQRFFTENQLPINEKMPVIRGSIQSQVAESFLQAQKVNLLKDFILDFHRIHFNIFNELSVLNYALKKEGLMKMLTLELNKRNKKLVENELLLMETRKDDFKTDNVALSHMQLNGQLSFNCDMFHVCNSYDACHLIHTIIGKYYLPNAIKKITLTSYVLIYLQRKIAKYLMPN
jgi:glycosyltransferase involved in cell wall biosynthesis